MNQPRMMFVLLEKTDDKKEKPFVFFCLKNIIICVLFTGALGIIGLVGHAVLWKCGTNVFDSAVAVAASFSLFLLQK